MIKKQRKTTGRMASKGFPNPVDVHVGDRIRRRRTILGLSQTTLAERMGITFQQVQKYERGTNRVSSSRLFDLSRVLDVSLTYFFDEIGIDLVRQSPAASQSRVPSMADIQPDPAAKRETLELVRAYYGIKDRAVRLKLTNMIRAIGTSE